MSVFGGAIWTAQNAIEQKESQRHFGGNPKLDNVSDNVDTRFHKTRAHKCNVDMDRSVPHKDQFFGVTYCTCWGEADGWDVDVLCMCARVLWSWICAVKCYSDETDLHDIMKRRGVLFCKRTFWGDE